jgi:hypothetical protein
LLSPSSRVHQSGSSSVLDAQSSWTDAKSTEASSRTFDLLRAPKTLDHMEGIVPESRPWSISYDRLLAVAQRGSRRGSTNSSGWLSAGLRDHHQGLRFRRDDCGRS